MDLLLLSAGFLLFWSSILFTHYILTSCLVYPYINLSKSIGLKVKPFYLGVYFNRFEYGLTRYVILYDKFIKSWMNLGVFVSLFLTPVSICILLQTIVNLISYEKQNSKNFGTLEPLLPGVNLPFNEIFYYIIALIISSVFHEFGHFIAALKEGIKVNGVGISFFAFLPIAYVNISEDQLNKLAILCKLRIFCAGVWHNLTLGLFTASLLLLNPFILSPFYKTGEGVVVLSKQENWDASGSHGIQTYEIITNVNRQCRVTNKEEWKSCFLNLLAEQDASYCVSQSFITEEEFKSEGETCCDENLKRHLCFNNLHSQQHLCLPVRQILERFTNYCNETTKCLNGYSCIKPKIETPGFRLMELQRKNKPAFLFWGHPYELYNSLSVVNYNPRFNFLSLLWLQRWETLLRYITSFSLALSLLNSIPCFVMDGKYITKSSLELLFKRFFSKSSMHLVELSLSIFGTVLVFICVSLGFFSVVKNHVTYV